MDLSRKWAVKSWLEWFCASCSELARVVCEHVLWPFSRRRPLYHTVYKAQSPSLQMGTVPRLRTSIPWLFGRLGSGQISGKRHALQYGTEWESIRSKLRLGLHGLTGQECCLTATLTADQSQEMMRGGEQLFFRLTRMTDERGRRICA